MAQLLQSTEPQQYVHFSSVITGHNFRGNNDHRLWRAESTRNQPQLPTLKTKNREIRVKKWEK